MVRGAPQTTLRAKFGVSPETPEQLLIAKATLYEGEAPEELREVIPGGTLRLRSFPR